MHNDSNYLNPKNIQKTTDRTIEVNSKSNVRKGTTKSLNILTIFIVVMIGLSLLRMLYCTIKGVPFAIPTFESLLLRLKDFSAIPLNALQIGTLGEVNWGFFQFLAVVLDVLIQIINVITLVFMGLVNVLSMLIGLLSWVIGI